MTTHELERARRIVDSLFAFAEYAWSTGVDTDDKAWVTLTLKLSGVFVTDDVVYSEDERMPGAAGRPVTGPVAMNQRMRELIHEFARGSSYSITGVRDLGDRAAVDVAMRMVGAASGAAGDARFTYTVKLRDGLIAELRADVVLSDEQLA